MLNSHSKLPTFVHVKWHYLALVSKGVIKTVADTSFDQVAILIFMTY